MGTIWIKELTGGLDARRLPETTPGGVLIKGNNGHITRGGEFEQRANFSLFGTLPAGTVGLSHDRSGLYVFGSGTAPTDLPLGVSYQQLVHPVTSSLAIVRIVSVDRYDNKLYVAAEFEDGSVFHYYDGTYVTDWFDGRARASFSVVSGFADAAVAAKASFTITSGTAAGSIDTVSVAGVDILGGAVTHTGDNTTTATAVASAITSNTSTPNYTATAASGTVTITAADAGAAPNGFPVAVTVGGDATVGSTSYMAGGSDSATSTLTDISVNGVPVISAPVAWAGTAEATASAIVTAINGYSSSPDYTATAVGAKVNILADTAGSAPNGYAVALSTQFSLALSPASGLEMAYGVDSDAYTPGSFVKTVGTKVYSVSDSLLHFSGIQAPTKWTTDTTGAGFINLAVEDSDASDLTSIARYQRQIAVFAPSVTMIWFIDPDPTLNVLSQVLGNTGTKYPRSVAQFGDSDVFYLDTSGLRSLRARDSSNAAATTDIGVPIDPLTTAKMATLTANDLRRVISLINPIDKRFWLIMKDEIFVFSFFENAKVSAWTTYTPGFTIDDATVYNERVYVRSGDNIYAYGGISGQIEYSADVEAEAHLPFLDANRPAAKKNWQGIDAALTGLWEISAALEPTDPTTEEVIARAFETSYNMGRIPLSHSSSHISLRFKSKGLAPDGGPAILSAAVIHYEGNENED